MADSPSPYTIEELDRITATLEHAEDEVEAHYADKLQAFTNDDMLALMRAFRLAECQLYEIWTAQHQRRYPQSSPALNREEIRGVF